MVPRPSAPFPIDAGLASTDREAAAQGVATAYLAPGWSWEGGQRSPDPALRVMAGLRRYRPRMLTDLRRQVRDVTHLIDDDGALVHAVRDHRVGYVVFNDHLERGPDMARGRPADFAIGARIAECPTSRRAAAAQAMIDPVVTGAPEVVRGGNQSGHIAAADRVAEGFCDALVPYYHCPALSMASGRSSSRRDAAPAGLGDDRDPTGQDPAAGRSRAPRPRHEGRPRRGQRRDPRDRGDAGGRSPDLSGRRSRAALPRPAAHPSHGCGMVSRRNAPGRPRPPAHGNPPAPRATGHAASPTRRAPASAPRPPRETGRATGWRERPPRSCRVPHPW